MRIGIDASNIRAGGGLTHLIELINSVRPLNHGIVEINVWASQSTLSKLPNTEWLIKQSHPFLNKSILFRIIWQKFIMSKEAEKYCDILFLPSGNTSGFHPYVSMCQNLLPFESEEKARFGLSFTRLRLELLKWNQCQSFRKAEGVIFLSDYSIEKVEEACGSLNNAQVISHGVSDIFRSNSIERKDRQKIKLLYVSIINMYKHQWQVVRAIHRLLDLNYNLELTLVGSQYPPALLKVKDTIEERPEYRQYVHIESKIPYEQLPEVYREHDIFVFASTCETFGMIVLEAMASGLPVACSDKSSMKEILGDAGIYFDPLNVDDISYAIQKYLDDTALRRSMGEKAHLRSEGYSWEKCAEDTLGYITEVHKEYS